MNYNFERYGSLKARLRRYWARVKLAVRVLRGNFSYMTISTGNGTEKFACISIGREGNKP